jgi:hypothetical protein
MTYKHTDNTEKTQAFAAVEEISHETEGKKAIKILFGFIEHTNRNPTIGELAIINRKQNAGETQIAIDRITLDKAITNLIDNGIVEIVGRIYCPLIRRLDKAITLSAIGRSAAKAINLIDDVPSITAKK